MVCPFRVVVVSLSLVVALIAAIMALQEPVEKSIQQEEIKEEKKFKQICWEFYTGKYLINEYQRLTKQFQHSPVLSALSIIAVLLGLTTATMIVWSHQTGRPLLTH